ncbi:uncharacterized protein LOC116340623 [Contarinia nasturtii]|uniref:uncharacterized protein LOC116340623 n=1 Tax=Contarinia nasturtii TaxID=265458 RepID=UPI0012D4938C|nr:uncharacterized protein LOC116340623 [Contarinia nasturtii]
MPSENLKHPQLSCGNSLRVKSSNVPPFMSFSESNGFEDGIEHNLLQLISKKLQLNLLFEFLNATAQHDILQQIINGNLSEPKETDCLVGGLYSNNYTQRYFLPSMQYDEDDLTWCVKRMEPLSFWPQVRYAATKTIWILCYTAVFTISIVLIFLMKFHRDQFGYMSFKFDYQSQEIALPAATNRFFRQNDKFFKILYNFLWIFCVLTMSAVWNLTLIKLITSPSSKYQIRTVAEMIENNYNLIGSPFSNVSVSENVKFPIRMKEQFEICVDIEECLHRFTIKDHKKYALAVSRKWIERKQFDALNKISCFEKAENLKNYSVSLLVRKDFGCMNEINEIIRNALEAGLIQKWKQDGQSIKLYKNVNAFSSHSYSRLSDVIVIAIALFISVLVILAELVVDNRMESLNRYNISIFIYKSFWTRRHAFIH